MRMVSLVFLVFAVVSSGAALALPDVVVSSLSLGTPVVRSDGGVAVRAYVVVRNQGTTAAGRFKLSAEAMGNAIAPTSFFTVSLQAISGVVADGAWYVWTANSLAAGASASFTARIFFSRNWRGRTIRARILGDSCAGDEFMQPYCRVRETSEANNYSASRTLVLP